MNYADIKYPTSGGGSGTQLYTNIADLPLTGNNTGAQVFVSENNRLYIWNGTGWYNIALVNTTPTAITGTSEGYVFATDGTPIEITLVSSDPEGIPLTWSYAVTNGSLENGGGTTATVSQEDNVFTITPSTNEDYAGEFSLTFTASDGVNLATATSSFTLAFITIIPDSKYTTLMVKAETAGSNTTFVDSSTNNFTITRNGDVTQGTFSPYGNAWSINFNRSRVDSILTGKAPGTGSHTYEFFFFINTKDASVANQAALMSTRGGGTGADGIDMIVLSDGAIRVGTSGTTFLTTSSGIVSDGVWYHLALVRNGTTSYTLYLDGSSVGTFNNSTNLTSTDLYLGIYSNSDWFKGYISNFRYTRSAVYTSNFTTPTEPLSLIADTEYLVGASNRYVDLSPNNFTVTRTPMNGSSSISRFGPYDQEPYDPSVNSGAAYFDGTSDRLDTNISVTAGLSGNYTIEAWLYLNSSPSGTAWNTAMPLIYHMNGSSLYHIWGLTSTPGLVLLDRAGGSYQQLTGTIAWPISQWFHLAITNVGTTVSLYVNGVLSGSLVQSALTWYTSGDVCSIGGVSAGTNSLNGYISNLRVVNGTALYTANFTPPTAPLTAVAGTSLLLKCDNGNIVDYSGNNNLAVIGNTAVNTTTKKYGSGSMYFDGTGDYLTTGQIGSPNLDLVATDFTIEGWFYNSGAGAERYILSQRGSGTGWELRINSTNQFQFFYTGGGSLTSTGTIPANTWTHIAVSRNGTTVRFFINGVLDSSATFSNGTSAASAYPVYVGYSTSGGGYYLGYIEDLRITKGLARYTANFTPPTSELLG